MGDAHLDFHVWHEIKFPRLVIDIFIFILIANVKYAISQPSATGCILNLENKSPLYKASYVGGSWGGFLSNKSCGGVFDEYLFALAHHANQTGKIFLNSTEQRNCLTTMKASEVDVLGCGIQNLTSGRGGCSDFSVNDVNRILRDDVENFKENCELVNLGGNLDHSCGSCLSSWEDIKGIHSDNGKPTESEAYMCRFAVLVSLTSANIEDDIWIQKIDQCLMEQDQDKYRELEMSPETGAAEVKKGTRKISRRLWILIGGIVGVVIIVIISTWALLRRHFQSNAPAKKDEVNLALPKDSGHLRVSIKEVYSATNNLDISNFIGEGTAGKVYKGVLSSDQHVAVKQITDEGYVETFFRELRSLSQVRHPNLVALLGYCEHKDQCFLLYELCPNGNLSEWLFGKDRVLSWISRLKIAIDSARGLWFLHTYPQGCIVHRDIKPTNILLGANFEAKLSDFGLSKVIELGETYMSSEVRGTFGYVDPEYQRNSRVNPAGDVYSFGVVLLQIISGKKVINMNMNAPMPIDKMAKTLNKDGSIKGFADPKLEGEYSQEAFELTFKLALSCTALKKERPSMDLVAIKLEEALDISTRAKPSTPHYTPGWSSTPHTTPDSSSTPQ